MRPLPINKEDTLGGKKWTLYTYLLSPDLGQVN